jgi:hypothetical protein
MSSISTPLLAQLKARHEQLATDLQTAMRRRDDLQSSNKAQLDDMKESIAEQQ